MAIGGSGKGRQGCECGSYQNREGSKAIGKKGEARGQQIAFGVLHAGPLNPAGVTKEVLRLGPGLSRGAFVAEVEAREVVLVPDPATWA